MLACGCALRIAPSSMSGQLPARPDSALPLSSSLLLLPVPCQQASRGATNWSQQIAVHMTAACCQQSCKACLPSSRTYMHSCCTARAQACTASFSSYLQSPQRLVHSNSFRCRTAKTVCIKQGSTAGSKSFPFHPLQVARTGAPGTPHEAGRVCIAAALQLPKHVPPSPTFACNQHTPLQVGMTGSPGTLLWKGHWSSRSCGGSSRWRLMQVCWHVQLSTAAGQ